MSQPSKEPKAQSNAKIDSSSSSPTSDPFYGLSFKVGVAENKNTLYRNKMEDVHTYIANFAERVDWGYFAIFDGHAGKDTARWCGNHLHRLLEEEIEKESGDPESTSNGSLSKKADEADTEETDLNSKKSPSDDDLSNTAPLMGESDLQEKLYNSFVKADELIAKEGTGNSGCTAVVAVVRWETDGSKKDALAAEKSANSPKIKSKFDFVPSPHHKRILYTSNVGDSRIVLYRKGQPYRLSYDHKASDVNEINRVRDSGGLIMKNRVNGVLAVTRSLGDSYMKDLVIGKPFTTATEITEDDEFMILACDGVWDVISDLRACEFVADILTKTSEPQIAAKKLCQFAIDNSTTDNVTVMIVMFDKDVFKTPS